MLAASRPNTVSFQGGAAAFTSFFRELRLHICFNSVSQLVAVAVVFVAFVVVRVVVVVVVVVKGFVVTVVGTLVVAKMICYVRYSFGCCICCCCLGCYGRG